MDETSCDLFLTVCHAYNQVRQLQFHACSSAPAMDNALEASLCEVIVSLGMHLFHADLFYEVPRCFLVVLFVIAHAVSHLGKNSSFMAIYSLFSLTAVAETDTDVSREVGRLEKWTPSLLSLHCPVENTDENTRLTVSDVLRSLHRGLFMRNDGVCAECVAKPTEDSLLLAMVGEPSTSSHFSGFRRHAVTILIIKVCFFTLILSHVVSYLSFTSFSLPNSL